ncbi:MAG TPA: YlxR family protein [Nocardioidaceae bacterium]|nr:YlxR family protein [Nocardioidaceae bacterium]
MVVREHGADACVRTPVRTCVGCRERSPKQELLRVVARGSGDGLAVVPDPGAREPGRGAYIHPTPACLELATRRRAFARALRVQAKLDGSLLRDYVQRAADPSVLTDRKWSSSS